MRQTAAWWRWMRSCCYMLHGGDTLRLAGCAVARAFRVCVCVCVSVCLCVYMNTSQSGPPIHARLGSTDGG